MISSDLTSYLPVVVSINISAGGIPKRPVDQIGIYVSGLKGDGHNHEKHYRLEQAVSLQDIEKLEELKAEGYSLEAGTTGENLTVKNLNVNDLPLGTILEFPSGLRIELSKVRKPCYVLDSIHPRLKEDIVDRCGMYALVLREGMVRQSDAIKVIVPSSTGSRCDAA